MKIIRNYKEYESFKKNRTTWSLSDVDYKFKIGFVPCHLCGSTFESTGVSFLMCLDCTLQRIDTTDTGQYGHFVYGLYSDKNTLVYIGVTNNPHRRFHEHMTSMNFKRMKTIKSFNNRDDAEDFKKFAIYQIKPPYNRLIETDWVFEPNDFDKNMFVTRNGRKR